MNFNIDTSFIKESFCKFVNTASPTGYSEKLNPVIEEYAKMFNLDVTYDNKDTPYITLDGNDNSKTVLISAHADTLGLMVRKIDPDGKIRFSPIGGINFSNLEGENVTVHTRCGKDYTGIIYLESHSTHAFKDALTLERNENTMMILLDEDVKSIDDVKKLGIDHGDYIFINPRCTITPNGYIKSRFIDDKGGMACVFAMLKYLFENNLKPKYKTIITFPYWEETGTGGAFVPPDVCEFVAVDIGLIGSGYNADEKKVSICAKDALGPYNYELTTKLINYAKKHEIDHGVDIYLIYRSDADATLLAGNNLKHACFGMSVYASHGVERTHIKGMENTAKLLISYVLDE